MYWTSLRDRLLLKYSPTSRTRSPLWRRYVCDKFLRTTLIGHRSHELIMFVALLRFRFRTSSSIVAMPGRFAGQYIFGCGADPSFIGPRARFKVSPIQKKHRRAEVCHQIHRAELSVFRWDSHNSPQTKNGRYCL